MMLSADEVTRILKAGDVRPDNAFQVLQSLCWQASNAQTSGQAQVQELVLRALDQRNAFAAAATCLTALCGTLGCTPT